MAKRNPVKAKQEPIKRTNVELMFLDVAGYSLMGDAQLKVFLEKILPELAELFDEHRGDLIELNTWGDAIIVVCTDPYKLARLALDLRDFFKNRNWAADLLPTDLSCRIALHGGAVHVGYDPLRQRQGIVGSEVNLAARIEPVTPKGEVWVTDKFMARVNLNHDSKLSFDALGEQSLAKNFGAATLYRLRRSHEPEFVKEEYEKRVQDSNVATILESNGVAKSSRRSHQPNHLSFLAARPEVHRVPAFVGNFTDLVNDVAHLAEDPQGKEVDILVAYRIGDIRRVLSKFRDRPGGKIRLCFPDMWDTDLVKIYQRKYFDRTAEYLQDALKDSIRGIIGPCEFEHHSDGKLIRIVPTQSIPVENFEVRLTRQRVTYAFYRIDDIALIAPLDMKAAQKPAPLMWAIERDTAPETFQHYVDMYDVLFEESDSVFPL
jgi:class 3 adenylate cyclase